MEPPPIRDIVLVVATVCANNSLACQLLFFHNGRQEREEKPGVAGSALRSPLAQGLLLSSQRHLDVFLFSALFFLKGLFLESHTQACCLYCEVQPLYYQASGDLILLNEVID